MASASGVQMNVGAPAAPMPSGGTPAPPQAGTAPPMPARPDVNSGPPPAAAPPPPPPMPDNMYGIVEDIEPEQEDHDDYGSLCQHDVDDSLL